MDSFVSWARCRCLNKTALDVHLSALLFFYTTFLLHFMTKYLTTPFVQDIILRLLLDVAQGMAELHRRGIIHADLKPSNIMLVGSSTDPRGWVAKVSDAALLPLLDLTLTHTSIKHHSRMQCLPPELVLQDVTSPPLDVYCFAMLMWKSWTCERPFKGMDMKTFFNDVIERGKRPPVDGHCTAGMPPAYKELMQACWAADPAARPSFEFICEKLRELFSSLGPQQ